MPRKRAPSMAAGQPFPPEARHHVPEPLQRPTVARDSIVRIVTTQLLPQDAMLLRERLVQVSPAPESDPPERSPKTTRRRLAAHDPVPMPCPRPVVAEPQQV